MSLRAAGAIVLALCGFVPAARAAERLASLPGFTLRYDDATWTLQRAPEPLALLLSCAPATCGPAVTLSFILDPRPLLRPGAGAFGPGAVGAAGLDIRAQALTPGARLVPSAPIEPLALGGVVAYRGRYGVESRDLARSRVEAAVIPLPGITLHVRLDGEALPDRAIAAFLAVAATVRARR